MADVAHRVGRHHARDVGDLEVSDEAEVGTCDLCGQEMIRTADDCWHPWDVATVCPPQPAIRLGDSEAGDRAWRDFYDSGLRTGRPGREHFAPAADNPAVRAGAGEESP